MNDCIFICFTFFICFIVLCIIVTEAEREENRRKELVKKEDGERETNKEKG